METIAADERGVLFRCPVCGQTNRVVFPQLGKAFRCGKCKQELPELSKPIEASSVGAFQGLLSSSLPLLVDFWAEWCGPCKMMAPELDRFAWRLRGRVAVAKVNTEVAQDLASRFQISAIPTLVLIVDGQEAGRLQGAQSSAQLERFVGQVLGAEARS